MQRYWDLSERERSELTEDRVREFQAVELMEAGVVKTKVPELEKETIVELRHVQKWGIEHSDPRYAYSSKSRLGFVFETETQAAEFLALCPLELQSDYYGSGSRDYARPIQEAAIVQVDLYDRDDLTKFKEILDHNKEIAERNKELTSEYEKNSKVAREATEGLWADWYEQRRVKERCQSIMATWNEYARMTNGDRDLAREFLLKAHDKEEVAKAEAWVNAGVIEEVEA